MSRTPEFSIVVPCYNEAASLPALAEAFGLAGAGVNFELILVDNGSSDGTPAALARLLPLYPFIKTVKVDVNRGYGFGIRCGLAAASGKVAGWTHADLQFDPAAVFQAAAFFKGAGAEKIFVKGLRLGRPFTDRLFTAGMSLFETLLMGVPLRDINGQPTLFDRALLDSWTAPPDDFSLDLYACVTARKAGFRFVRFGVQNRVRLHGVSSWNRGLGTRLALARRTIAASLRLRALALRGRAG